MSYNEFWRYLVKKGVYMQRRGAGSHMIICLGDKCTVFPNHGSKEIPNGTRQKILKDLGL